jgi:hypothetical protein
MLSLEMLGSFGDQSGGQHYPVPLMRLLYPSRPDFVAIVGRIGGERVVQRAKRAMSGATSLPVHAIVAPRTIPGVDYSDHASYWDVGVEAAMITDTAFFRNERYHTASDRPETLDYARMSHATSAIYAAVIALGRP